MENQKTRTNTKQNKIKIYQSDLYVNGTVAEFIVEHPALRPILEQLGIDYCCGGKKPFLHAVRDAGHDIQIVLNTCKAELEKSSANNSAKNWSAAGISELAEHILAKHHIFTRSQIERADKLLAKTQQAHAAAHGPMLTETRMIFNSLRAELVPHLDQEEQNVFPAVIAIDDWATEKKPHPVITAAAFKSLIRRLEDEHDSAGHALSRMRATTNAYILPSDACATFEALYEAMQALESDLHEHIHLENNILFPGSLRQAKDL